MSKNDPDSSFGMKFISIAHCSPQLERIAFQGDVSGIKGKDLCSLQDLIGHRGSPTSPIRLWPFLKHLELRFISGKFWESARDIEEFIHFLLLHDQLGFLIFRTTHWTGHTHSFSLAAYPGALTNLRRLHGSLWFISGVVVAPVLASLQCIFDTRDDLAEASSFFDQFVWSFS